MKIVKMKFKANEANETKNMSISVHNSRNIKKLSRFVTNKNTVHLIIGSCSSD